MTKKQFVSIFVLLALNTVLYMYFGIIEPIGSKGKCADNAMQLTYQQFKSSFVDPKEGYPIGGIKAESAQEAKATYDFLYDFCMNKRGWDGN